MNRSFKLYMDSHRCLGSGMVEVAAMLFIFLIVCFAFLDFALLFQGAAINDSIAKNAARSAAIGPPGKLEKGHDRIVLETQSPYKRACVVVQTERASLWNEFEMIEPFTVKESIDSPVPSQLFGGPVNGTVTVETTMTIHPKFILGRFLPSNLLTINGSKTFPYTWVMKSQLSSEPIINNSSSNK